MEPADLFSYLESNQPKIVEDTKNKLHQIFSKTKDSWLLYGLFDYYLSTNSARAVDIIVGVREPHDKYLFDKLSESLKNPATKVQALTVLGHVLRREPAWLYKITQHQLLKDLLKLLKTEMEILPLLSALLVIVVLLPMMPARIGPYLQDIFDIFSRLAAWNCNPGKLAEEQLIHLQVAMYSLFLRLYGMYPCNFLAYLRTHYRQGDNMPVFIHTVKPMLGTVKIHPLLVTATKDNEVDSVRWKRMGHHEVIIECEKYAVDMGGGGSRDDSCYMGLTSSFRSRSGTTATTSSSNTAAEISLHQSFRYPVDGEKDFWSPSLYVHSMHSSSPPPQLQQQVPVAEVCASTSVPHTPSSQIPNAQNFVSGPIFPQEGTSPPEAAIEATPETTPIKDPRSLGGSQLPAPGSNVARALTNLNSGKWPGLAVSGGSTPSHSQPSSPMRKEPSPFRFSNEGSAFEPSGRRDTAVSQKLFRIMQDRSQVNESNRVRSLAPATSPLRMLPARHTDSSASNAPDSPVPLVDGPTVTTAKSEWGSVARPRPERNGLPSPGLQSAATAPDATQEDQEVVEIVRQGEINAGASRSQLCDSVLQEDGDFEAGETQEELQHQGSPCTSGGLHMPNSRSLQVFATRVHRLRYYSQCGPAHDNSLNSDASSTGSSPGQGPSSTINPKVRRANSCPEMKKNYGGPLQHAPESLGKALDESDELNMEVIPHQQHHQQAKPVSNGVSEWEKPPQRSTSTQTLDLWPMPYEHLFLDVLPLLEMNTEARASPSPSPAPHHGAVRFSPYEMLDKYIEQAAQGTGGSVHGRPETELRQLREQLGLVHMQLQYERYRREVHATRNRRLLGESRNNRALDEHNSALRDQVAVLQKEIEHLNEELKAKKNEADLRERELHEVMNYWQDQCLHSQEENIALKSGRVQLQRELEERAAREATLRADYEHASAELLRLAPEMNAALEQAAQCDRFRVQLERTQRELLLAGELVQRYRERLVQWPLLEHRHEEARLAADAYHDEIRYLSQQLDARNAVVDSQRVHLQELENATQQRDELCASQKRMLKQVKEEYHEQLCAVETKYETQRAINRALEARILELWQRIEALEAAAAAAARASGRPRAPHSPDTSSCHEAGADRTSAAAGGLSPHSSPLSASLASSEGSVAFMQHQDVREIKNLQVIVDQSEGVGTTAAAITAENNTPDGGNSD